jgi:hypothetical protein
MGAIVVLSIGIGIALSSSKIIFSGASASLLPLDNVQCNSMEKSFSNSNEDDKEANEPDYDEDKDHLEEKQESIKD